MTQPDPSRDDPVVRTLSVVVGGPAGDRVGAHPWWRPVRVLLAVTTATLTVGMAGRAACVPAAWSGQDQPFAELCWTELAGTSASQVGPGVAASYLGRVAGRLGSSLAPSAAPGLAAAVVLAVLLGAVALTVTRLLAGTNHADPWAAAGWAAAPLLTVHWLSWDLLAACGVALLLVARVRPASGAGVAGLVLVVAFAHPVVTTRVADTGSVWLLVDQAADTTAGPGVRLAVLLVALVVALVAAYVVVRRGRSRDVRAVARAGVVVVGTLLLVAPSAPPESALLLLPLAAVAVPHWRDLLAWQACELLAWMLTGWYLGGALAPSGGGDSRAYWLAVLLRLAGVVWLVSAAVRAGSGHGDAVERRGGEADPDIDLVADAGHARP